MSVLARVYIYTVVLLGGSALANELYHWQSQGLVRFLCYLALAVVASRLNLALPAITSSMSLLFVFILFGIVELSLPEAVVMGCIATVIQSFWFKKKPKIYQTLFNVGSMSVAIATTGYAYHSSLLTRTHLDSALMLVTAATVFFVMNTFPVAMAISLTEGKPLRRVWTDCYFWSFPYYLLGAAIAGVGSAISRYVGWQTSLLVVPIVYLVYRSYYLYLGRMEDEKKHAEEMASLHLRTIEALALAIEAKDHTTGADVRHGNRQRARAQPARIGRATGRRFVARHRKASRSRTHHLETRQADARRVREDEDPSGGGRRNSGARALSLSGHTDRAFAS
jgi:hypothetical protein